MSQNRRNFIKSLAIAGGLSMMDLSVLAEKNARQETSKASRTAKMKLSWFPYNLQLKHAFNISNYSRKTTPVVLVTLEYDGLTGYGEAALPPYLGESQPSVVAFLEKIDLSGFSDPLQMDEILHYVDSLVENNTAAKAAVDIALHDLAGKIIGKPWYQLWGLNIDKIPDTTFTIGMDTEEILRQKVKEVEGQYKILKIKLGGKDDRKMVETIRSVTALPIAVDANQGWKDKHQALEMIHWLKEKGIVMIEQPMSKYLPDDIAWLTAESPLPIFADESIQRLHDVVRTKGVFSGINIKLMKCTGMREAWKMRNLAQSLDMKVMIGCMTETSCAISAAAQLAPGMDFADLDGAQLIQNDAFSGAELINGKVKPLNLPGIGVKPV